MNRFPNFSFKKSLLLILALIGILTAFSLLVIKDFSSPLTGWTGLGPWPFLNHDYVDQNEYPGFFLAKNLTFTPFPKLDLLNNQSFYPYGTSSVFLVWSLEKDIFYAILYTLFGASGPWLQIYYLVTILITAVGTYILLFRDYGLVRASGVAFLVSFCNFYAINKYPHHFNLAVIHWITLGFITDFLIVKRVVLNQHISLRLILIRVCLLLLSFGHDLGYIAGFGLMSFTVSILFIAMLLGYRAFSKELRLGELLQQELENYKHDFYTYPRTCLSLLGLSFLAGYIYLPLVFQIAREAKSFDFTGVWMGSFDINPFRIFIPFFPIINNPSQSFKSLFRDSPEAIGGGSPGWFLVILGTIGLWQSRKKIIIFLPLLTIFIFCLFYIPQDISTLKVLAKLIILILATLALWLTRKRKIIFIPLLIVVLGLFFYKPTLFLLPTLKVFPWFTYNRVAGRCTIVYPVILCLFALHINFNRLLPLRRKILVGLLVFLACIEFGTAYSFRFDYAQPTPLDNNFFTYMDYVKKQPGEAVLDWPFCVKGGGGATGICPYGRFNSGIYTLRRFHEKKVMGTYFGRLHSSQVEPYLQAGWDKLFFPDETRTRQARCFNEAEWSFFTDFYKFNDFAGINLYLDRLPKDCLADFYTRFGTPAVETVVPGTGVVQFIPKSAELRNQVNLTLGTSLKFIP